MAEILILNLRRGDSTIQVAAAPAWSRLDRESGQEACCTATEAAWITRGRRVCVLIHGYRVADAWTAFGEIIARIEEWYDVIILVFFAGGKVLVAFLPVPLKWLTPWDVFDRADRSAGLLAMALGELQPAALDVQTHSLGARVGLGAVERGLQVRNLLLAAPAVPRGCLCAGGEFVGAPANARRILIACSERDEVLAWLYAAAAWGVALGRRGPDGPVPENVVTLPCADVGSHSGHKRSAIYLDAWREVAMCFGG